MSAPVPDPVPCWKCNGCGQVANTDRQEPWTAWEQLPVRSAMAVVLGLVRPVLCPQCDGTGRYQ